MQCRLGHPLPVRTSWLELTSKQNTREKYSDSSGRHPRFSLCFAHLRTRIRHAPTWPVSVECPSKQDISVLFVLSLILAYLFVRLFSEHSSLLILSIRMHPVRSSDSADSLMHCRSILCTRSTRLEINIICRIC